VYCTNATRPAELPDRDAPISTTIEISRLFLPEAPLEVEVTAVISK
jgi:hypothetical protein